MTEVMRSIISTFTRFGAPTSSCTRVPNAQRTSSRRNDDKTTSHENIVRIVSSTNVTIDEPGIRKSNQNGSSLYDRFWELHRRLSNPPPRKLSEGDATTAADVEEKFDEGSSGADVLYYADNLIEEDSDASSRKSSIVAFQSAGEEILSNSLIHFEKRFGICTVAHLVMAPFVNCKDGRLARRCVNWNMLQLPEVSELTKGYARVYGMEHLPLKLVWCTKVTSIVSPRESANFVDLMWHNESTFRAVDHYLLTRRRRGIICKNLKTVLRLESKTRVRQRLRRSSAQAMRLRMLRSSLPNISDNT